MSDETPNPDAGPPPTAATPPTPAPEPPAPGAGGAPTDPAIPVVSDDAPTTSGAPVAPTTRTVPSGHVAVPKWLLVTVAAILGAALMFGVGYVVGDRSTHDDGRGGPASFGRPFGPSHPGIEGTPGNQPGPMTPGFAPSGGAGGAAGNGTARPTPGTSGAFLGVATQQTTNGVEVTQVVSASAAKDAGIEVGDVITGFDGNPVTTPAQLANAVANADPGDSVKVTFERNGESRTVTVTLGSRTGTNN